MELNELWGALGLDAGALTEGDLDVHSPIDGAVIARVKTDSAAGLEAGIARADAAFVEWRRVPAPRRGELIRLFAEELRAHKEPLGGLVTLECGKILQEGLGEVQEMIDICDFAVGLSRQLHGLTIASERPGHRMMETWHPLGAIGVITAFNFPVAVWAWNFALAVVCGDSVVWKPSEKTPLAAFACRALFARAGARFGGAPEGLAEVVVGDAEVGERLVDDRRLKLISATGSCRMGRRVGPRVAARLGRTLLELGGNNAMVVGASADLDLAVRAIVFAAVGTAGQRCTTLRRLIVHEDAYGPLLARLKAAYESISIGDPRDPGTLVGPLIERAAFESMEQALAKAAGEGGAVFGGARVLEDRYPGAYYVEPAIVEVETQTDLVRAETFAPVLYVLKYRALDQAIGIHNDVPQGLSSSIFTRDLNEAEAFLSADGSDCGIANVNIGPSGAEIGGAFGGEKDTGGGRESGSDAWKNYMRRATNTINYSNALPLAQGITFGLGD
ncbi:MAG: aldehyde dehydrogenase family protein [Alphaproteobacteria bacterium]|nr:aldehyde dehydrogenase family protein [Alphaproteobacteria bacterium]